jgi:hypothetical protein
MWKKIIYLRYYELRRPHSQLPKAQIWLRDWGKEYIDQQGAAKNKQLRWERHDDVAMKGFPGVFTLWSARCTEKRNKG